MSGAINIQYLTTAAEVQDFVSMAAQQPWVAVDTEFVRERTYVPLLCLLQVATPTALALIDVLALPDPQVLQPLLDGGPLKIVHSPGQDFEALATLNLNRLAPVFDTQWAHALLGGPPQIGYAGIVRERMGVDLAKDQTRTDWSRRPLNAAQRQYAADDVIYLGDLCQQLQQELDAAGRTAWMAEDMAAMASPFSPPDPWQQALRARSLERLEPRQQQSFVALSAWRDGRARAANLPRSWVLKDGVMLALARQQPSAVEELEQIADLPPALVRKHAAALVEVIQTAPQTCPPLPQPIPNDLLKRAQRAVAEVAQTLEIDPSMLGTRADIEGWLRDQSGRLASGWRHAACAEALQDLALPADAAAAS